MNKPEFCVRIEVAATDNDTCKEFHVVLGGAQRGGLSVAHGYVPSAGSFLESGVEHMLGKAREMLEAYASTLGCQQVTLWESQ